MPATVSTDPSPYYQHIVVRGLPYDRGFSHGSQIKDKIHTNVAYYKLPGKLPCKSITSKIVDQCYIPALKTLFLSGWDEMRGIADGAELPIEDIVMLNARYDLARIMYRMHNSAQEELSHASGQQNGNGCRHSDQQDEDAHECTSVFFAPEATADAHAIAAQNWDMDQHLYNYDLCVYLEVHPDPSEDCASMFCLTEAGQLIRTGMNSAGLAVTANSLMSSEDYVPISHTDREGIYHEVQPKLVLPLTLARRIFLSYRLLSEALVAVNALPRHVSGNLHVSTGEGFGMALEVSPNRIYKVYGNIDDNYVIHTNHFAHSGFLAHDTAFDRSPGGSSWFRWRRVEHGIRPLRNGQLTPKLIARAFSDHLSYPESLCSHPNSRQKNTPSNALTGYTSRKGMTVAFVMYDLTDNSITCCKGGPCTGVLQRFRLVEGGVQKSE